MNFKVGTVYSPDDLMWHGHFNTGTESMRHFAMRGDSPKYSHDRFRNPSWTMIPMTMTSRRFSASTSIFSRRRVSKRRFGGRRLEAGNSQSCHQSGFNSCQRKTGGAYG